MTNRRVNSSRQHASRHLLLLAVAILTVVAVRSAVAEVQQIDPQQSVVNIYAYKAGLFKAFADDHQVRGNVEQGTINDANPAEVHLTIKADALKVLDPGLSAKDRSDVQTRMLGPDVLDVNKFPEIKFDSESVAHTGPETWTVRGKLTLHGQTRPLETTVTRSQGHYKGAFAVKQTDFGITPVTVAGGAVKVKDEIKIDFDIVAKSGKMTQLQ